MFSIVGVANLPKILHTFLYFKMAPLFSNDDPMSLRPSLAQLLKE